MQYDVDIWVNEIFMGTRRVEASDPQHAEELVDQRLVVEYDVNEIE